MPEYTQDTEYTAWCETYRYAVEGRQQIEKCWRRWYNILDDSLYASAKNSDGSDAVEVNELASIIETIVPNIILNPGRIEISAIKQENVNLAVIYEYIAKYILTHYNIKEQFIQAVVDTLTLGDSLIKVGYWLLPLVQDAQWRTGLTGVGTASAFALHTPLFEFYPDYHVKKWSLQRFFIHEVWKHIDELKDNELFEKSQVDKLKPSQSELDVFDIHDNTGSKRKEYVKLQEIHNLITGEMLVMSYDGGPNSFLMRQPEEHPIIPFERLSFFPRPLNLWGTSVSQRIERHLISLSRMHSGLDSILRKLAVFKFLYDGTKWKSEMVKLLKTANDEVIPTIGPPEGSYQVIDLGIASKQFVFDQAINLKLATIRSSSGVTSQQQGVAQAGIDTAFEVNTLQSAADVKNKMRLSIFEAFAQRVLEKLIYLVSVEYTSDRIAGMVGFDEDIIRQMNIPPYDPSKYIVKYGESAVTANQDKLQKLMILQQSGLPLNPVEYARQMVDALGLEWTDELIIQGLPMNNMRSPQQGGGERPQGVSTPGASPKQNIGGEQ
jgi:hypothetical protein